MIIVEQSGCTYLQFPNLLNFNNICHGVTTRLGGASPFPYHSLNVGKSVGDDPLCVEKNRDRISRLFNGFPLILTRQVHGTDVFIIKKEEGTMPPARKKPFPADALVTDLPGIIATIQLADCQGILLYDPLKQVVANIHAGWRGGIADIIGSVVKSMVDHFYCDPARLVAGIGPSLGPCCAEFIHYRREIPRRFWIYKDQYDRFDFWMISHDQLVAAGVLSRNIHISRLCTKCRTDLFFSYRKEKTTGRFASVIALTSC